MSINVDIVGQMLKAKIGVVAVFAAKGVPSVSVVPKPSS